MAIKPDFSAQKPLNREPCVKKLTSSFITHRDGYDRNHGMIPRIDAARHIVCIDGAVKTALKLSIDQLKSDFKQYEVVCALQCAGNRRHTMRTLLKEVDGIDWGDGAVMNCRWSGPKLRDVLVKAQVTASASEKYHVAFACFQTECQEDSWYGSSIELERAMRDDGNVILALKMNGEILSTNHGYPVRVIVPGIAGARSVKWLDRITIQAEESKNFYQQRDYKILPPEATCKAAAAKYWDTTPAVQDMPVNSIIASPQTGETAKLSSNGLLEVKGYALPQGDQGPVVKIEVSVDNGKTWHAADISEEARRYGKWSWVLWTARVKIVKGPNGRILSRATDEGGNTQVANPQWNLRGVCYNGYGESRNITVD